MGDPTGNYNRTANRAVSGTSAGTDSGNGVNAGQPAPGQRRGDPRQPETASAPARSGGRASTGGTDAGLAPQQQAPRTFHHLRQGEWLFAPASGPVPANTTADSRAVTPQGGRPSDGSLSEPRIGSGDRIPSGTGGSTSLPPALPAPQLIREAFPELPPMDVDAVADTTGFLKLIESALELGRNHRVARSSLPQADLRGPQEPTARRDTAQARPPLSRHKIEVAEPDEDEVAEKSTEAKRRRPEEDESAEKSTEAKRRKSEKEEEPEPTGGARVRRPASYHHSIPHYLMERQIGAGGRTGRNDFASVRHDVFAVTAMMDKYDVAKLKRYSREIDDLVKDIKEKRPNIWKEIENNIWVKQKCSENAPAVITSFCGNSAMYGLSRLLVIRHSVFAYFLDAFSVECTLRFLREAATTGTNASNSEDGRYRQDDLVQSTKSAVGRELSRSVLLTEKARSDFNRRSNFEKIFIPVLIDLYDTRNFRKAKGELLLKALACWPGLPGRRSTDRKHEPDYAQKARKNAEYVRRSITHIDNKFGLLDRGSQEAAIELTEEAVYYYYVCSGESSGKYSGDCPDAFYGSWYPTDCSAFCVALMDIFVLAALRRPD